MWYIVVALILLIGIYGFSIRKNQPNTEAPQSQILFQNSDQNTPQDPLIKGSYSKKDIEEKLQRLAKVKAPQNLAYGAKCYKVARPAETMHYICPICGEKTVYKSSKSNSAIEEIIWVLDRELHKCRSIAKSIEGINVTLDESEFCKKCSPNITSPQLCVKVNIAGTTDTNRVCDINASDMRLIYEFIEDELVHQGNTGNETPLKNYIGRIEELIGVKLKK